MFKQQAVMNATLSWDMNFDVFTFVCLIFTVFCVYKILKIILRSVYRQKKRNLTKKLSSSAIFFNSNVSSWQTRRNMGHYENYLTKSGSRLDRKLYSVLVLKSKVTLRREVVQNALVLLSRKHPLLRANVDVPARGYSFYQHFDMTKKQFVILKERQFWPELRFVNTSHWSIVLEEELLLNKVDYTHLWRTILLREQYHAFDRLYTNTLLFFFDQVIMDRRSIIQFIEDFVKFLCKLLNCDIHVADTKAEKLQEPVEDLLREPTFWKSFSLMTQEKLHSVFSFASSQAMFQQKFCGNKGRTKPFFLRNSFSTEETLQLLNICDKMNCSLTSVFTAAWLMVQASNDSANCRCEKLFTKQDVTIIVDCRSLLTTQFPSSYLGNCSSKITLRLTSGQFENNFWEYAKDCEKLLKSAVKNEIHLDFIWKMKYRQPNRNGNYLTSRSSLEISDVGRFNLSKQDPFMVEDIYIAGSGVAQKCITLVVINDKLFCGIHWTSCLKESFSSGNFNALFALIQKMCCPNNLMVGSEILSPD